MRRLLGGALLRVAFWLLWGYHIAVTLDRVPPLEHVDEIVARFGRHI